MSTISNKLLHLLTVIPVIIMWTFANTLISFVMAGVTFLQLISVANWNKTPALIVSIFVAILVHSYLYFQPNIRRFIFKGNNNT